MSSTDSMPGHVTVTTSKTEVDREPEHESPRPIDEPAGDDGQAGDEPARDEQADDGHTVSLDRRAE